MNRFKLAPAWMACGLFLVSNVSIDASTLNLDSRELAQRAAAAQVPFERNDGQIGDDGVSYYARTSSGTLFVTVDGALVYSLQATRPASADVAGEHVDARWAFRESFVDGAVVVVGETASVDFPTSTNASDGQCGTDGQCDQASSGGSPVVDAFIARLSGDLSRLEYGSYLGGSDEDRAYAIALDGAGNSFVGGNTSSADFPTTPGAFDNSYNGGTSDAFISKFRATAEQGTTLSSPGETCGSGMPLMRVEGMDAFTSTVTVSYAPGCATADNNVYFGSLDDVSSYGYSGQVCNVGLSGMTSFSLPKGSYFFVIVGDNDSVEGSYGRDGSQAERPASGSCGFTQDLSSPCVPN